MTVTFHNVGSHKKNWIANMSNLADRELIKQIRRHGALMSRDIDFVWNEDGDEANIFVGMFRNVGKILVCGGIRASFGPAQPEKLRDLSESPKHPSPNLPAAPE